MSESNKPIELQMQELAKIVEKKYDKPIVNQSESDEFKSRSEILEDLRKQVQDTYNQISKFPKHIDDEISKFERLRIHIDSHIERLTNRLKEEGL